MIWQLGSRRKGDRVNVEQSSTIRNALTIVKGRAHLARRRLWSLPGPRSEFSARLELDAMGDMQAIDEAVGRIVTVLEQMEGELSSDR